MELDTALRLLNLPSNPTVGQVQTAYRRLVKKYHPDANPRRSQWAHTMMTRLQEAYLTATDFACSPSYAKPNTTGFAEIEKSLRKSRALGRQYMARVGESEQELLDAVHYYYAHGLDKVHLRTQGSQHLRYRRAVRRLVNARNRLQENAGHAPTTSLEKSTAATLAFAEAFLDTAKTGIPAMPATGPNDYQAYRHLARGAEFLDTAIRSGLFPDLPQNRSIRGGALSMSFHELMLVLTNYRRTEWLDAATMRLRLLDAFKEYRESKARTAEY
jgi:hypothetical protein